VKIWIKFCSDGEWDKVDGVLKRHGTGTFEDGNNKYSGEWKDDKISGKGKFIYSTGAQYEVISRDWNLVHLNQGDWVDGKYEGFGNYKFEDGSMYTGQWRENRYGLFCRSLIH
jgi:hypothetical protein